MKATITDIKRFAVHDGDGIRTTIFFKGCPLKCVWCHNPETLTAKKQLAFYSHKCMGCGNCVALCDTNRIIDGKHIVDRNMCNFCSKCETVCPNDALKVYGREMSVEALLEELLLDKSYYDISDGGITLSGGECLLQADFCAELLKRCKEKGLSTAVDTSGYIPQEALDAVIPYTDIFLYDLKAIDEEVHIRCTGVSNRKILENALYLDSIGKKMEIRIPYIPEYNDDQVAKIATFVDTLRNVTRVRVLPYHNYAESRYHALGMKMTLPQVKIPEEDTCKKLEETYFYTTKKSEYRAQI